MVVINPLNSTPDHFVRRILGEEVRVRDPKVACKVLLNQSTV